MVYRISIFKNVLHVFFNKMQNYEKLFQFLMLYLHLKIIQKI